MSNGYTFRSGFLLLLLTVAALLISGCGGGAPEEALEAAEQAMLEGQFQVAVDQANKVLRHRDTDVSAQLLKGLALTMQAKDRKALEVFARARQNTPDAFYPALFHGWALARADRCGEALEPLETAVELRPDHVQARILIARCCLEQNLPEGIPHLRKLANTEAYAGARQRATLFNDLGYLYTLKGDHRRAEEAFRRAIELNPGHARALQNMAVLHDRFLDRRHGALRYYRYALGAYQKAQEPGRQAAILQRLRQMAQERME